MAIEDLRLILGLAANVAELAKSAVDPQSLTLLKSSRTMLAELHRRHDRAAAAAYYEGGRSLLRDAATTGTDPDVAHIAATALHRLPETLPQDYAVAGTAHLETIRQALWSLLAGTAYPATVDQRLASLLERLLAWEHEGYAVIEPRASQPDSATVATIDAASIERYLRRCWPGFAHSRVVEYTALAGGFSKQTVLFDVQTHDRLERFVYRGAPKIQIIDRVLVDIADEFHTVSYAYTQKAVVAEPLWLESDPAAIGTRFFISRRAAGINLGTAIQAHADITPAATRSLAEALAGIHGLSLKPCESLQKTHLRLPTAGMPLRAVVRARIDDWHQYFKSLATGAYPTLELAFQWLKNNASAADGDDPVLVHGDYGLHNILVEDDRVRAVLDWEACHVGDRALDLSHILAGTAGKMDPDLFMKAYVAAGGRAVSDFRLKYYQVLMNMQFMLSTIHAQHIYQHHAEASTNYCTLGLGFIHYTATNVHNGILLAAAANRDPHAGSSPPIGATS